VCVPSDCHAEIVIKALESGRPTLCEKPMAITLEQTDAMLEAAERTGQPLMIAQVVRFMGPYEFLKENVEKGTWGKLLKAEFHRLSGVPRWSMGDWMRDPARSGGVPLDLHIHDVDFVHYLLGKPFIILATACSLGATKGDKDMISAAFDYGADGPKVDIEAQWTNAPIPFTAGYTAIFEEAYLIANGESLTLYENDGTISEPDLAPVNGYEEEIRYFAQCVEAGIKPEKCLPESARDSVALVFAELQALKEGGQLYL
jgi:predicted dehydrogenase